jgi:hypothetical protein
VAEASLERLGTDRFDLPCRAPGGRSRADRADRSFLTGRAAPAEKLAPHDRPMLEQAFALGSVSGSRYGAARMAILDRGCDAGTTDAT